MLNDSFIGRETNLYYSSIGILALLILLITNYDVLKTSSKKDLTPALSAYKLFLISVIIFYLTDILWGVFYSLKIRPLEYIDTNLFFIAMMLSVFLWIKYVISYLNEKNLFSKILYYVGAGIFVFEIIVLIINIFLPVVFYFDEEGIYHTSKVRFFNLIIQLFLFFATTVYMLIITSKKQNISKTRHHAVGFFGFAMTIFIAFQAQYPFMPFYAMGLMLGLCLLHTFVVEDEKEERRKQLEALIKMQQIHEQELGAARYMAYTDPLTGVKNKAAYIEEVGNIEKSIAEETITELGIVFFDLNGLKIINDTQGHEKGDEYIKAACKIICQHFKHSPVFRIGGDEFVAILKGEDFSNHKKIMEAFTKHIQEEKAKGGVIIASGFSEFHKTHDRSFMRVFERADKNMYKCKKNLKS